MLLDTGMCVVGWQANDAAIPAGEYVKPANTKRKVEAVPKPALKKLRSITMTVE